MTRPNPPMRGRAGGRSCWPPACRARYSHWSRPLLTAALPRGYASSWGSGQAMRATSPASRLPGRSQHTPIPARQPTRHIIRAQRVVEEQQPLAALDACTLTHGVSIYRKLNAGTRGQAVSGPGNWACWNADRQVSPLSGDDSRPGTRWTGGRLRGEAYEPEDAIPGDLAQAGNH